MMNMMIAPIGGPSKFMDKIDFSNAVRSPHESSHAEKMAAFTDFIATHGRSYATKSQIDTRFDIFSVNFDEISEHNANPDRGYEKAIN
jgi:hypothetical protein